MRHFVPITLVSAGFFSACGDNVSEPDPEVPAAIELAFTDISASSADLFDAPFKGNPGWDTSDKYSPGVALADFDGDGNLDLVQPRNDARSAEHSTPRLYRGMGDGTFEDATPLDWDVRRRSPAAIAFDFDGDDDLDVFIGVGRRAERALSKRRRLCLYRRHGCLGARHVFRPRLCRRGGRHRRRRRPGSLHGRVECQCARARTRHGAESAVPKRWDGRFYGACRRSSVSGACDPSQRACRPRRRR